MAARRKKRSGKRSTRRRGQLAPGKQSRGLDAAQVAVALEDPAVAELAATGARAGGAPIGAYREPLGGRPLLLASLPLAAVQPTPFQRDLSPTHAKRLAAAIEETGGLPRPAHRGARRRRAAVDPQRAPPPRRGEGAGPEADHGAHLAATNRSPTASSRSTPRRRTTSRTAASR